jgi:arylsulfatase A-like enzyme
MDIGYFLDKIKDMSIEEKTIVIFTSEHGDIFGKQGRFMRGGPLGGTFYDDVLKIPLIMKIPGIISARIDGLVQHIDIMPTLLDLLSLPKSKALEGKSLLPLISQNKEVNQYVFAGSEFSSKEDNLYVTESTRVEAVRNKQWKLIREDVIGTTPEPPIFELYNIENDKEELYNLADTKESMLGDLKLLLSSWSENMRKK